MPYTRRPTWSDRDRQDFYMNGHVPQVPGVPISGTTETLDEAGASFRRSYEAMRQKAGLPKPQRR